uniref:Proteasome assembly chaperone 2 n=1 Tax=Pavo cristatus TaxID=9049 RepID=A0A8C9FEW6_PAVCR
CPIPAGSTPAVSVGNVGQLAVDLVISTLRMPKVGYFYTDCLVPMVGNNPYATTKENSVELSINAEGYRPFCQTLLSWVESSKCARVILLSSSHAYQRDDEQLLGTPLRYLLTPALKKAAEGHIQELKWKEMEKVAAYPGISDTEKVLHIPGGGITKLLFIESCSKGIHMAVLLKFCSEGDNIPDAFGLVNYLNEWLQLIKIRVSAVCLRAFIFYISYFHFPYWLASLWPAVTKSRPNVRYVFIKIVLGSFPPKKQTLGRGGGNCVKILSA